MNFEAVKNKALDNIKIFRFTSIDSYILKNFIPSMFGSLIMFMAILELTVIFQDLKYVQPDMKILDFIQLYLYDGMYYAMILEPFSFLFATVYTLSTMAQNKELIAIVSTGTSVFRVSFFMIVFTVLFFIVSVFFVNDKIIYPAYQKRTMLRRINYDRINPKDVERDKDNKRFTIFGANKLIYIVNYYDSVKKILNDITIVQSDKISSIMKKDTVITNDDWLMTNVMTLIQDKKLNYSEDLQISIRLDADTAVWDAAKKTWVFHIGTIRYVRDSGESFSVQSFTNETFSFIIDPPYYFENSIYPVEAMTYSEGKLYIEKLQKSKQDANDALAKHYSKFSYPFSYIFIVLIGIGIVDLSRRKNSFIINFVMSLFLYAVFFLLYTLGSSFGGKGDLPPLVGAYIGPFLLGVISIILFRRVKT